MEFVLCIRLQYSRTKSEANARHCANRQTDTHTYEYVYILRERLAPRSLRVWFITYVYYYGLSYTCVYVCDELMKRYSSVKITIHIAHLHTFHSVVEIVNKGEI